MAVSTYILNLFVEVANALLTSYKDVKEIDVHRWIAKGTLEYVARGVLGISLDTLNSTSENAHADAICGVRYVLIIRISNLLMRVCL